MKDPEEIKLQSLVDTASRRLYDASKRTKHWFSADTRNAALDPYREQLAAAIQNLKEYRDER